MGATMLRNSSRRSHKSLLLQYLLFKCLKLPISLGYQSDEDMQDNFKNSYNQNYFRTTSDGDSYRSRTRSNFYNGARDFTVCDESVVRVRELYLICDSPYTFYYGNGANRNSPVCNYGDKLSMELSFQVTDDIKDSDNIYVTMAVYDDQGNILISVDPVHLCDDLVGYECVNQGYYGFIYRLRLPYPSNDNNVQSTSASSYSSSSSNNGGRFLPYVHMAFSTRADSGYNLGALNIQCAQWNPNEPSYVSWSLNKSSRSPLESFTADYTILLASCLTLMMISLFVWFQASRHQDRQNRAEPSSKSATFCLMD